MSKNESRQLRSTTEVIEALGGLHGVAALIGKPAKRIWDWREAKTFPSRYFAVMWLELVARGAFAPPSLWGQPLTRNKEAVLCAFARKVRADAVGLAQVETLQTCTQLRGRRAQSRIARKA